MAYNILICNLTRFGDLLQTQPAICDLANAGHRVSLLCLENFAFAADLMRDIRAVYKLPAAAISRELSQNWLAAAGHVENLAAAIKKNGEPDWIINLTPTLPARLLTRILAGKKTKILGFGLDDQGFGENLGLWASFISVAAQRRSFAPFNLAHMFRSLVRPLSKPVADPVLPAPTPESLAWAKKFISNRLPQGLSKAGFIGIQLGASDNRRRWPVSHFARFADILWEKAKIIPILTGSKSEVPLGQEFEKLASCPVVNAIGQTSLSELAAILASARLLATNDTGTMHLAAGLGIPSLAFFLVSAQPWDTGPFLANCCCVEPKRDCHPCSFNAYCGKTCGEIIRPEPMANLALAFLQDGNWAKGLTENAAHTSRVWLTEKDGIGMKVLPVSGQEKEERTAWMRLMADFWSQLFDSRQTGASAGKTEKIYPHAEQTAAMLAKAAELLKKLIAQGALLKVSAKSGQQFLSGCKELEEILLADGKLESIAAFWREVQLMQGGDLAVFLPMLPRLRKALEWLAGQLKP